jgi:hypothetical protein
MSKPKLKLATAAQLEQELHKYFGKSIGWMGNVILVRQSRMTTRLKGLFVLAAQNRVAPLPFSMDYILIDGAAVPWSKLEEYASDYPKMRKAISRPDSSLNFADVEKLFDQWSHLIRLGKDEEAQKLKDEFCKEHGLPFFKFD